jgi:methyltransferase (TIGR00027 family)
MDPGTPSRTAQYMALFRALESTRPPQQRLFEDRNAACFLDARLRAVVRAARFRPVRAMALAFIDRRWPGPRLSGVVRTRLIDDFVASAVSGGCTQLLLLGAGYDTRALRLPSLASVKVFEVDHPLTQARKRDALQMIPDNVRYIPVDFEQDSLRAALDDCGFAHTERTCVVWEGVFSYLTPAAIDQTLSVLVELCAPASQIVLTYVDQRALEDPLSTGPAWSAAVRAVGEPFRTGLHPAQAQAFFAERRLTLCNDESTTEAALRLRIAGAQTIPGLYRLATLDVEGSSADMPSTPLRRGLRRGVAWQPAEAPGGESASTNAPCHERKQVRR